jgi:hypothetical protein
VLIQPLTTFNTNKPTGGHFAATGVERTIFLQTQGGSAFGMSAFLNRTYLGSWTGIAADEGHNDTFTLPKLKAGTNHVFTVVIDHMGNDEHYYPGDGYANTDMRTPRGILNYTLEGREASAISWKLTGNLGMSRPMFRIRRLQH